MRITLIGPGKVGSHLGAALLAGGHQMGQVFARDAEKAAEYARKFGATPCHRLEELDVRSDLYLLTVSDDAIGAVAEVLARVLPARALVVHSSGATPRKLLDPYFERNGVFYPLQSFSPGRMPDFRKIPICVDARQVADMPKLETLARSLSQSVHRVSDEQRAALHVAAVFANNFTNQLFAEAAAILEREAMPFELLLPLMEETVDKVRHANPASMQTGPALRGDLQTMSRHLTYLRQHFPGSEALYELISQRISLFSHSAVSSPRSKKTSMNPYQNLLLEERDGCLIVTINREKALNALNTQTMLELKQLFGEDLPGRSELHGVVLTGAGSKAFVAGADIKEFLGLDAGQGQEMAQRGHDIFFLIERFAKPVIAAVNGFALGGGCELAMACHLRVASENARFGQPEVNLGLLPGYGGTQRLIQYIGKGKAMELLLTADMIGAEEAHRLGLVNHVVPEGQAVEKALEIVKKIASKGPVAIAKTIESVNAYFQYDRDGFEAEVQAFGDATRTEDFKEGAAAFIEKRQPNFKGQ